MVQKVGKNLITACGTNQMQGRKSGFALNTIQICRIKTSANKNY